MNDDKNLEVVSGDGSNLEISPVYNHINTSMPKSSTNKPKNIVVPKELKEKDKKHDDDNNNSNNKE